MKIIKFYQNEILLGSVVVCGAHFLQTVNPPASVVDVVPCVVVAVVVVVDLAVKLYDSDLISTYLKVTFKHEYHKQKAYHCKILIRGYTIS